MKTEKPNTFMLSFSLLLFLSEVNVRFLKKNQELISKLNKAWR